MKGFLAGVAVAVVLMAAFPTLGRWVTTLPYRTFGILSPAVGGVPAAWQAGGGRGGRMMAAGCPRTLPADYVD